MLLKALAVLCTYSIAGATATAQTNAPVPAVPQDTIAARGTGAYDWCRRDAYAFGAIGAYRRLFVLSCLDSDATSSIRVPD